MNGGGEEETQFYRSRIRAVEIKRIVRTKDAGRRETGETRHTVLLCILERESKTGDAARERDADTRELIPEDATDGAQKWI